VDATRYRAPPAADLIVTPLDDIVALFHRTSGMTHLVASPVPEVLEVLAGRWMAIAEIEARFDIVEGGRAELIALLDELAATGLIERA
jgi:PqqD family protein of HPr-rel-A system